MSDLVICHEQDSGEACATCGCELVLVVTAGEADLSLECDCGVVACVAPGGAAGPLRPAA